jgi:hypothetical protein
MESPIPVQALRPDGPGRRADAIVQWGMPMALEHEVQVFRDHLIDLLGVNDINEGTNRSQ